MLPGQTQLVWVFQFSTDPEPMISTCGLDPTSFSAPLADLATAGFEAFETHILPRLSHLVDLVACHAESAVVGGTEVGSHIGSATGGVVESPCIQNTGYLVRKLTGTFGRGKNGRMYLPGVPLDQVGSTGQVNAIELADWNTNYLPDFHTALYENAGMPAVNHGLVVDPTDPPPRVPSLPSPLGLYTEVNQFVLEPQVATQRRRLRP